MAQSTSSGTSSRRHARGEHDTASLTSSRYVDAEWEAKEALRQRELEEARARATQMEKTMRWWSDCTANWREKWSKVRNERNKAREESKILRAKLEAALKDSNSFKRDKLELELKNEQLKKDMEKIHLLLLKHAGQWDQQLLDALQSDEPERESAENNVENGDVSSSLPVTDLHDSTQLVINSINADLYNLREELQCKPERDQGEKSVQQSQETYIEEYVLQGAVPRHAVEMYNTSKENAVDRELETDIVNSEITVSLQNECLERLSLGKVSPGNKCITFPLIEKLSQEMDTELNSPDREHLLQKLSLLQLRLDEASKTIENEREEKSVLQKGLEQLKTELIGENRPQEGSLGGRLSLLRSELERLQAENASEWGRRERLETEKLILERDNKKLRVELRDLQERLDQKQRTGSRLSASCDAEFRQELAERTKELSELKHAHSKLKKVFQEKSTELAHAVRRAEQYEAEVKRLRGRVEEVKRELAVAEDEVDAASNSIRKLQRANDELQEQVEGLQVQLEHLHSRIQISSSSTLLSRRGKALLPQGNSDDDIDY